MNASRIIFPDLGAEEISSRLKGPLWRKVLVYESVGSTNDVAAALAKEDDSADGTVIVADSQDRGRGRHGRSWVSPPGMNIYMSLLLRPGIPLRDMGVMTLLAAVSAAEAIRRTCDSAVTIKWPNDLVSSEKKLGGILTEVRSHAEKMTAVIIGIGLNVNSGSGDFPSEVRDSATSLKEVTGRSFFRAKIAAEILNTFEYWYDVLRHGEKSLLLQEWRRLSSTLGKQVRVVTAREELNGTAEDIDEDGLLILRLSSGDTRRISAGDLTVLR